jgi:ubiquinone/menaquinone biosynthesis C-methylase UbiE
MKERFDRRHPESTHTLQSGRSLTPQLRYFDSNFQRSVSFLCMDARDLQFADYTFDVVLDKGFKSHIRNSLSGTFDGILCGNDFENDSLLYLSECYRVLKPGGVFICISAGSPEKRQNKIEKKQYLNWKIEKVHSMPPTIGKFKIRQFINLKSA